MNIRTTKIVAPLLAMALCTPNIAFAQEGLNQKTISGRTDVNGNFSLTRSISVINGNNSISQDRKTIYVNPGDTINVRLDLKGKTDRANHGFTSFKEEVSPIQASSAISGSLTVKKSQSTKPLMIPLNNLNYGTFGKTSERTIEFNVDKEKSPSGFGEVGNQVIIDYSYTAGDKPGEYKTQFKSDDENFGLKTFDAEKLDLTIVVKSKEDNRPTPPDQDDQATPPDQGDEPTPPEQGGQDTPPEQDEQAIPPKSNKSTVFSWLTKTLGVLAFLGGTVWFIIKHLFRL
ncbi:membrane protein [Corynebacterium diphtheriae]|nr:membrane protein [Corynebacterium diphtheriae]CAB0760244.1 membrane protein [Corynebacterium diphtheriae]